jgi:hypothetical protein
VALLTVRVLPAGTTVVPLPVIVPPVQVPPLFRVSVPMPPSVPPDMLKASADPLALSVAVPPVTVSVPAL